MLANWDLDLERDTYQRDKIKRRALTLLTDLRSWRQRWDSDERNSYFETSAGLAELQPIKDSCGNDSPPFLTTFEFSNDSTVTMLMFYHTVLVCVLRVLASLPLENLNYPSS